jgi:serine/threonine protein kinase
MSPEQVRDEQLGPQADLFSLGAVLYEMLTGTRAFSGNSVGALLQAVLVQTPKKIRSLNANVPAKLETAVEKLLQKDRAKRYQTAAGGRSSGHKSNDRQARILGRAPVLLAGVVLLLRPCTHCQHFN